MKTKWMLLPAVLLAAPAVTQAATVTRRPLVVTNLTGDVVTVAYGLKPRP